MQEGHIWVLASMFARGLENPFGVRGKRSWVSLCENSLDFHFSESVPPGAAAGRSGAGPRSCWMELRPTCASYTGSVGEPEAREDTWAKKQQGPAGVQNAKQPEQRSNPADMLVDGDIFLDTGEMSMGSARNLGMEGAVLASRSPGSIRETWKILLSSFPD